MKVYGAWAPVNAIWPESRHVSIVFFRPEADSGPYTRLYFSFFTVAPPRLASYSLARLEFSSRCISLRALENLEIIF